jgi:hypothetical protein
LECRLSGPATWELDDKANDGWGWSVVFEHRSISKVTNPKCNYENSIGGILILSRHAPYRLLTSWVTSTVTPALNTRGYSRTGPLPFAGANRRLSPNPGSKILLMLKCRVEGWAGRHDSRRTAVLGPSSPCPFASTPSQLGPVPDNVPFGVEESRSAGKADGQSLRWLDYVPCV